MVIGKRRGQVWIETVIYTLIGLAIIGLVLSTALPKINNKKDEIVIEQSIEALGKIDEKIYDVIDQGVGNRRVIDLDIQKGKLIVDMANDEIKWVLPSGFEYSQVGVPIPLGSINVTTSERGGSYEVELKTKYKIDIQYNGMTSGIKQLDVAPVAYKFIIENTGVSGGSIVVDLSDA
jgi:hypothetical protein